MSDPTEINESTYVYGIWYFELRAPNAPDANLLLRLQREGEQKWHGIVRIRIYADKKVFESNDERKWFIINAPPEAENDPELCKREFDKIAARFPGRAGKVVYVEIKGGSDVVMDKLSKYGPPFHVGMAPGAVKA